MGGFDWDFTYDEGDEAAVRAMLAAGRRRARRFSLRWRSRIDSPRHYAYVAIDGPWQLLDLLVARLERDLPTICEAVEGTDRAPASLRRLGHGFVQIAVDRRFNPVERVPHLRTRKQPPEPVGCHLLESPNAPDLQQRLSVTERMLADWYFGEVAPEVMLEELHSAFELTLARVLYGRYRRDKAFQQLIDEAVAQGVLDAVPDCHQFIPGFGDALRKRTNLPPLAPYLAGLLSELKDVRKHVRHRGANTARAWLDEHFWPVATALEGLAPAARSSAGVREEGQAPQPGLRE
jgi:hypothetical protein